MNQVNVESRKEQETVAFKNPDTFHIQFLAFQLVRGEVLGGCGLIHFNSEL